MKTMLTLFLGIGVACSVLAVDMIRQEAITQQVPLGELLKYDSTIRGLNPKGVDFRGLVCVDDAFSNAGIRIR